MSARQLLDTSTATWADLFSNGKKYAVPAFQRDYSWGEDQWSDLWRDVVALNEANASHYMGTIVLKEGDDGVFEVIDGQQRLATLSILALATIHVVQELAIAGVDAEANQTRVRLLKDRLVSAKHPASLQEESRLKLNKHDDGFFQSYLVQLRTPPNPGKIKGSERGMWEAFEYFKERLAEKFKAERDGAVLALFLTDTVAAGVQFIKISVQDDLSAYTVFETLNARGLQLTATDLLKNYLFSLVAQSPSDLELIQAQWGRLIGRITMEDFPDVVYHYLVSLGVDARKQRLFADMRALVNSREKVFDWMNKLQDAAEWYVALSDPNDELWDEFQNAKSTVRELVLFRVDQYKPLVLAARDLVRTRAVDAGKLLRMCSVVSLRATIIAHRNTADVLRAYQSAVKAVRDGKARNLLSIFEALRSLYPEDEEFQGAFSTVAFAASGARKKLVKYLLSVLEGHFGTTPPDWETDSASIEHILPENPSAEWGEAFSAEDRERFTQRLGNLTLLEPALNREVANATFDAKRAAYRRSRYAMTHNIVQAEWNPAAIKERQGDLARRAAHCFRLDF